MNLPLTFLVSAVLSVAVTAGPSAVASASNTGGLWGAPIVVTHDAAEAGGDTASVIAISCGGPGDCSAVGRYSGTLDFGGTHSDEGFVAVETHGSWGAAQEVASDNDSLYRFADISCPSPGNCAAVGTYTGNGDNGFVMDETDGAWGAPQVVADPLSAVSCPAAGECTAVGSQGYGGQAVAVTEAAGTWDTPQVLPGSLNIDAALTSVSCVSAGACSAGGYYDAQPYGPLPAVGYVLLADETNGTWQPVHTVTGSFTSNGDIDVDRVTSMSCSSAGNCSAAGYYGTYDGLSHAFVVSEADNSWHPALDVATSLAVEGAQLTSIACPGNGNCSAAGFYLDREDDPRALVVNESNGTWQPAQQVAASLNVGGYAELVSLACVSVGNCSAGGFYANNAEGFVGLVVNETDGTWGPGEAVATSSISDGLAQVNTISCPSAGNCAAGGVIDNADGYQVAFVVDETPITVPAAPNKVTAVAGRAKATVKWTAPSSNGGASITSYTVTSSPGKKTCKTTLSTSCTVTGLTNGTRYVFDVTAANAAGNSVPAVSNPVIPTGPPGAPTITKISARTTSATVTWKAPASDGGRVITGYWVYIGTKSGQESTRPVNAGALPPATRSYTLKGLKKSTRYYVIVRAKNAVGLGAGSNQVSVVA